MDDKEVMRIGFGHRVKQSRENLNLSRKEFAEIIDISEYFLVQIELGRRGVSNATLCKSRKEFAEIIDISEYFLVQIELGRRGVSNATLCKMSEALCISTDYLLTGRAGLSDISSITSLLEKVDAPFLIGAEMLLKGYINSISFIKAKVEEQVKGEN